MAKNESEFDHILFDLAEKHDRGLPDFLQTLASFLRRRTDFFDLTDHGGWEELLLHAFREERKCDEEVSNEEAISIRSHQRDSGGIGDYRYREELARAIADIDDLGKYLPNEGNGCSLDKYVWTQTLESLKVMVTFKNPLPVHYEDIDVNIGKKTLKVGLKGQEPIINGELAEEVNRDESAWVLEDNVTVVITLGKVNRFIWWNRLVVTDPEIALSKIKPESLKLSELDPDSR